MSGAVSIVRSPPFEGKAGADAGPRGGSLVNILGVDYLHSEPEEGGDLYLTAHGVAHARPLQPNNWFEKAWFRGTRDKLNGTASIYTVPTRPVRGESIAVVVKYNRVGTRVPIQTNAMGGEACDLEFNGPFEEFALVHDLRGELQGDWSGAVGPGVTTQLPLAIYVPPDRWSADQLQRYEWRVANKVAQHPAVAIDIMREYLLIYSYLPGLDAYEAFQQGLLSEGEMHRLDRRARRCLESNGFHVLDMKPEHVIVQTEAPWGLARDHGELQYGVIDYELLERTSSYSKDLLQRRRTFYELRRAAGRGEPDLSRLHGESGSNGARGEAHQPISLLGVDYLHGRAESTGGMLWLTDLNPELFDYYLPERWRTTLQLRFLETHDTYFTTSKDNVRFVWKVCRVGELGEMAAFGPEGFRALAFGFNSPFEEFALARHLNEAGVTATTPLAIYRTGYRSGLAESRFDRSRYERLEALRALDGRPALDMDYSYITIWEPWHGPGGNEASSGKRPPTHSLNLRQAGEEACLCDAEVSWLMRSMRRRLLEIDVEPVRLVPAHILVAVSSSGAVVRDRGGEPMTCLCNFQHLRWHDRFDIGPATEKKEGRDAPGQTSKAME